MQSGGIDLVDTCRQLEIAESTWNRWMAQYGGMKADDAKRLKKLEPENTTLRKLLAVAILVSTRRCNEINPNQHLMRRLRFVSGSKRSPVVDRGGVSGALTPG